VSEEPKPRRKRTVVAGSPEHIEVIRGPLVSQIQRLESELESTKTSLRYCEDARASAREANAELKKQLDEVRAKAQSADMLAAQVQGLQGYIDALRDAGMAPPPRDPHAPINMVPGDEPWRNRR